MRLWWCSLTLLLVATLCNNAQAQMAVGPNGVSTPPINLLSVFKFVRDIFVAYMYPKERAPAKTKTQRSETLTVENREGVINSTEKVRVVGFDEKGGIVEKFDSDCDDGDEECVTHQSEDLVYDVDKENRTVADAFFQNPVKDKTGTAQLVVGKWPILYIALIITLFWLLIVIAAPYILAGESIGRREDDPYKNNLVDQQDVFLLLSFLLGEVSEDNSCLERVVCMTPSKSSNYITISSMVFKVAKFLESWGVPYSHRYVELLDRLNDVAHDGYNQSCDDYFCPTVPNI